MQKLRYGVFQVRQDWKLYSDGEAVLTFQDRSSALAAGERAVRDAMGRGCEVEFHLQEPTGELRQADVRRLAH